MATTYSVEEQRKDLIRQIRAVGENLIKNAESIVGTEKILTDLYINVTFCTDRLDGGTAPSIDITKSVMPEQYIDYLQEAITDGQN